MAVQVKKVHDVVTIASVAATGATAGTNTTAVRLPGMVNAFALVFDVTAAATEAGDLLDVKVQTMIDGVNWIDVCYFTQVLGNGGTKRFVAKIEAATAQAMFADTALTAGNTRNLLGDQWRVNYVIVDAGAANAAFTFTVKACPE